jgi:hypothetical protein
MDEVAGTLANLIYKSVLFQITILMIVTGC